MDGQENDRGNLIKVPLGNWNLFLKPFRWLSFKEQDLERACKRREDEDEGNFEAVVSTTLLKDFALEDNPISNSLDLTSSALYSMLAILEWYLIKDCLIKGERKSKTGLKAEEWGMNKLAWGRRTTEYSKKTPNLAKKNEI